MAIVSILMSLCAALVAKVLQSLILRLCRGNRIFVVAIARILGSAGLVYLAYAEGAAAARMPMLCVYIFRSALLNSILGMTRSVVMDFARSSHRAKYSAMESVSNLGWSGSAVVGGILVDKFGYRSTFVWTAGFHFAAALVVLPAARYVARLKPAAKKE
jgi:predicted MFS family arabinose efflux permease